MHIIFFSRPCPGLSSHLIFHSARECYHSKKHHKKALDGYDGLLMLVRLDAAVRTTHALDVHHACKKSFLVILYVEK
jgi:hypothetical protein